MAELKNDNDNALRTVQLEKVAEYLRCDPERLRIALNRLTKIPTAIEYYPGLAVMTVPADERLYKAYPAEEEVTEEEVLAALAAGPATMEELCRRIRPEAAAIRAAEEANARELCRTMRPEATKWLN
jgi:hypothetical protein